MVATHPQCTRELARGRTAVYCSCARHLPMCRVLLYFLWMHHVLISNKMAAASLLSTTPHSAAQTLNNGASLK
jgi:hypothetical protein